MSRKWTARGGLVVAALFALAPCLAGAGKKPAAKLTTLTGQVVPLADVVKKAGGKLDPDASPTSLVLVAEGGKVYPLVKDDGSRLFFKDKALLSRSMRLTGKLVPGGHLLMVRSVRSLIKGQPHDVYYWCEVCAIRRGEKNICECCGGPMELKEEPAK